MNKIVVGLILGAVLGALDGASAWFYPEVRNVIASIMVGSTIKGMLVGLEVIGAANAGIGHDRRAAARLVGGGGAAVAVAAGIGAAVERGRGAKLMADLVGHVINIKGISHGWISARLALSFDAGDTSYANARQAAPRGAEDV